MRKVSVPFGDFDFSVYRKYDDIVIRSAALLDADCLSVLERAIFPQEIYGSDVLNKKKFQYFLSRANALLLVAQRGDLLLGYALALFKKNSKTCRIYSIALSGGARGKGVAQKFIMEIEDFSRRANLQKISLETRSDNLAMQNLALKCGFHELKRMQNYYHDGADALKYIRDLSKEKKDA